LNSFWVDFIGYCAEKGHSNTWSFLSDNFIFACSTDTEMIGALSVLALPFIPSSHLYNSQDR
jgi:hypothetical protein